MKEPKRYEVNGKVYVTIPLGGRDAIKLDKMVSPLLFRLGQRSAKVKMEEMAIVLSEIFSEMDDSRFEAIRALTFKNTTYAGNDNDKSISLAGEVCYDHFKGRLLICTVQWCRRGRYTNSPLFNDGWFLDRGNGLAQKILNSRERDFEKVGEIGHLSQRLEEEFMFWNLVVNLRISPNNLEEWTLGEMRSVSAIMEMRQDYKKAWDVIDFGDK